MTNQQSNWMTIREAALALGVSELTIRRRIKDGRIAHRLVNGKYYVDLESTPGTFESRDEPDPISQAHHTAPPTVLRAVSRVNRAETLSTQPANVPPPTSPSTRQEAPESEERSTAPGFDLDGLLAEHARLAELAGRAGLLEDQLTALSARHEQLQEGMLSLAGRNGWLESKLEERESEIRLLTDQQPRAPWWKRLFGV